MSWPGSDDRIHSVTNQTPNKKPRKTEKKELPFNMPLQLWPHGQATYLGNCCVRQVQRKGYQPRAEERVPFKIDLVLSGNSDEADSIQGFTALKEKINRADRCDELLQEEEEYDDYMRRRMKPSPPRAMPSSRRVDPTSGT